MARAAVRGLTSPWRVIFDGQSRNLYPAYPDNYPWHLMSGRGVPHATVAVDGTSWTNLATTQGTRLFNHFPLAAQNVLVLMGGESDIGGGEQDTAAECYADIKAYADAARVEDPSIIIVGCTLLGDGGLIFSPGEDLIRQEYNALVLADAGGAFDYTVDLDVEPLTYATNPEKYADTVHFNTLGATTCAEIMAPTMDTILP